MKRDDELDELLAPLRQQEQNRQNDILISKWQKVVNSELARVRQMNSKKRRVLVLQLLAAVFVGYILGSSSVNLGSQNDQAQVKKNNFDATEVHIFAN